MESIVNVTSVLEDVVSYLNAKYPEKEFNILSKEDCGVDDAGAAEALIGFTDKDMDIINPFFSSCSRFAVDPKEAYGIDKEDAELISAHNKVTM